MGCCLRAAPRMSSRTTTAASPARPATLHDPHRDDTTLPLIPRAVAAGVPVLGICRGFQEMNVAFGGSLWQKLHDVPGHLDHREDPKQPLEAAVRTGARGDCSSPAACCAAWPAPIASASIRCTARACASSAPDLRSRRARPTASSRHFASSRRRAFCAGGAVASRSGRSRAIHFRARCLPSSARPCSRAAR